MWRHGGSDPIIRTLVVEKVVLKDRMLKRVRRINLVRALPTAIKKVGILIDSTLCELLRSIGCRPPDDRKGSFRSLSCEVLIAPPLAAERKNPPARTADRNTADSHSSDAT